MLALRLQRIGRRNEAHFKIVVIEKTRGPKSQKYIDIVGSYNPKLGRVIIDEEKAKKWLSNGVQPSDTVYNMLIDKGVIEGKKRNVLPKKTPIIDEEKLAQEKAAAEAEKAVEETEQTSEEVSEETKTDDSEKEVEVEAETEAKAVSEEEEEKKEE